MYFMEFSNYLPPKVTFYPCFPIDINIFTKSHDEKMISKFGDQDQFAKITSSDLDRTKDQDQLCDLRSLRSRSMIFLQLWVRGKI